MSHLTDVFFFFFFLSQRFNADYELTAKQGADTMAYIALLEEKLRPALVGTSDHSFKYTCCRPYYKFNHGHNKPVCLK